MQGINLVEECKSAHLCIKRTAGVAVLHGDRELYCPVATLDSRILLAGVVSSANICAVLGSIGVQKMTSCE